MAGLSLDQAPPYHSVYRFFLTAPLFAILASFGIVFQGHHLFISFISFKLIGIIHWMTLGFITTTMFGAIMQMLPVLAGVKIKNPVLFSGIIHATLSLGAFLFGVSYVFALPALLPYAGALITISVFGFSGLVLFKLMMIKNSTHTIRAMRLSLFSLMAILFLGLYLLAWRLNLLKGPEFDLLSVHFLWAFIGWVSILIMGVSFQVIPMFYVSPEYPSWFRRIIPPAIVVLLVLYTMFTFFPQAAIALSATYMDSFYLRKAIRMILYIFLAAFAIITYRQIKRRKRKLPDPSLLFWKSSMFFLFFSAILAATTEFYRGALFPKMILYTGMSFLFGFIFSVINGMMYKIVPFLSWFHLASKGIFDAPTMKDLLDDSRIYLQFTLHILFLLSLPLTVFFASWGHYITGMLLFFSATILWLNLYIVIGKYNVINKRHLKSQA